MSVADDDIAPPPLARMVSVPTGTSESVTAENEIGDTLILPQQVSQQRKILKAISKPQHGMIAPRNRLLNSLHLGFARVL